MSNSGFEDRLNRIKAAPGKTRGQTLGAPAASPAKAEMKIGRFIIGTLVMTAGVQTLRFANTSYDTIRDELGIPAALGIGLGGLAAVVLGIVLLLQAVRSFPAYAGDGRRTEPAAPASASARAVSSLLGLALGALASFMVFVGGAAAQLGTTGHVDMQTSDAMLAGCFLLSVILAAAAVIIGATGLLVRGRALLRVPLFFVLGAMLLYTSFRTFGIHPAQWPTFMAAFTDSFTT